jgi:hypothetical protein
VEIVDEDEDPSICENFRILRPPARKIDPEIK